QNPLLMSVRNDREEIAQILLTNGVDCTAKDYHIGWTALHCAAEKGHYTMAPLLLEHGVSKDDTDDNAKFTPLHCATQSGHEAIFRLLLESGVDPELPDINKSTALHNGAQHKQLGTEEIMWLLLEKGIRITSERDKYGFSALHIAALAERQNEVIFRMLLEHGASENALDTGGHTPLHCVRSEGILRLLLKYGADIQAQESSQRQTALHMAAPNNNFYMVKALLDQCQPAHH
ncbi:ankyrin repeat-containing domain protein, partial [Trichophaea hybrida]